MKTSRLRVTLRDVVPAVVRVIDVPHSNTLPELHTLLQVAVGWTDSHLHQFVAGETTYGVPDEDWEDQRDEAGASLRDLPSEFTYRYDFGDGWEHDVEVLGPGGDQPGCSYGEGACPPEDCGGPYGYAQLLETLADPAHDEHAEMRRWAGELADFEQPATDVLLRQTVGAVPASVRLVLTLAEGGVKLTPGGRLPRVFVRQVQEQRPHWQFSDRPASIEDDLPSLADLHVLLRRVGLLRVRHGVLSPTKAADDELSVIRRLRSWFAPNEFSTMLADVTVAALAASGPQKSVELATKAHAWLGYGWARRGQPLTEDDVHTSILHLSAMLQGLDLVEARWPLWSAGPSARSLLQRATMLSALWDKNQDG